MNQIDRDQRMRGSVRGAAKKSLYRVSGEIVTAAEAGRRTGRTEKSALTRISKLRKRRVPVTWDAMRMKA